jgi:prevent-host-death family protein
VALAKLKDDFSRCLRLASDGELVITRHGRPAGILIGFENEEAWIDYQIENHPEFLERVADARTALRQGQGLRLEEI